MPGRGTSARHVSNPPRASGISRAPTNRLRCKRVVNWSAFVTVKDPRWGRRHRPFRRATSAVIAERNSGVAIAIPGAGAGCRRRGRYRPPRGRSRPRGRKSLRASVDCAGRSGRSRQRWQRRACGWSGARPRQVLPDEKSTVRYRSPRTARAPLAGARPRRPGGVPHVCTRPWRCRRRGRPDRAFRLGAKFGIASPQAVVDPAPVAEQVRATA